MTLRRWPLWSVTVAHLLLVLSIVCQPLDPSLPPTTARSLTWRLHFDSVTWPGPGVDFFALYHAGVQARRGLSPYQRDEAPPRTPYYFRYLYSPVLAYSLGFVLAAMPPLVAYRVWAGVIELSLLLFLWVWSRRDRHRDTRWGATALLLVSTPYLLELHMGQFTFVATALAVSGVIVALQPGTGRLTGPLLLALGAFLKLFPLLALPALARRGLWWLCGAGIAVTAALAGSGLLFPGDTEKLALLSGADDTTNPHPGHMSLLNLVRVLMVAARLPPSPSAWSLLSPALLGMAIAFTAFVVVRRRIAPLPGFCLILMAFLIVFYRTGEHHFSAVLLLGVVLVAELPRTAMTADARKVLGAALVLIALPTPYALLPPDPSDWSTVASLLMAFSKVLPAGFVFVFTLRHAPRHA